MKQYLVTIKKGKKQLWKNKIQAESSNEAAERAASAYSVFRDNINWDEIEIVTQRID